MTTTTGPVGDPVPPTPAPADAVIARLTELGVNAETAQKIKTDLGVEYLADLEALTEEDFVGAGLKKIQARRVVAALKPAPAETVAAPAAVGPAVSFDDVLPIVPTDASWLEALQTGGILKVDQSSVISAVRATLAHRVGLFGIPEKLVGLMEQFADQNEEQVPTEFYALRKAMTRRTYAEIFEAIDGLDSSFVTEGRKKQLFSRIDEKLWPAIISFYDQLKGWQEAWMAGNNSPALMMSMMFADRVGGGGMMPPGMMQPPDTGVLRDSAAAVADAVNRVFAGTGVQIAAALAFDASRIKETLSNPRLPALIGAANRDQMLRLMGVAVSATYARLEKSLTQFVLSILQAKDQPAGNEELRYFGTLFMLGSQIAWDQLGVGRPGKLTGIGGNRL